jgi:hypothetical protein
MRGPTSFSLLVLSRVYLVAALVVAGLFSPLVYVPIPLLMLLLYLYLEFWAGRDRLKVPLNLFLALSLPLLFEPLAGAWVSPAFALPAIPLLDYSLRQSALSYRFDSAREGHRPTRLCLSLALSLLVVGLVALALGSWSLLLSSALVGSYLAAVTGMVLRRTSAVPAEAEVVHHRVLAGQLSKASVRLVNRSGLGGQLSLLSPYPWFHIRPARLPLDRPTLEVETSFTPPLAGPATVTAAASFVDPWGLIRTDFKLAMVGLFVVPRAKYAEWLARRYLEMGRAGGQEAMAAAAPASQRGSRRGMEFYGLRSYQPGDAARTIDWKHSLKLHQVIVKEFLDTGVEGALLVVNLSVTDEEEKDKLAYGLITTALTLAHENIPSALSAYSEQEVVLTTRLLDPRRVLLQALSLAQEVRVSLNPMRYLGVPNVNGLRGNIYRLRRSSQEAAIRLAEILQLEYTALGRAAQHNPATGALAAALAAVNVKPNVLMLSGCNHDAEALAFNQYTLKEKGYRVLRVELEGKGRGQGPMYGGRK